MHDRSTRTAGMLKRGFPWLLLFCAVAALVQCRAQDRDGCRHAEECPRDEICRLGSCEPKFGGGGPSDTGSARRTSAAADATNPTSGRPGDGGGTAPTDAGVPHCPDGSRPGEGELVLNEILPNVPSGTAGDANGDGTRDAFDDEFVEFVNASDKKLDLAGVRLLESGDTVWTVESTCLEPSEGLVVFGGIAEGATPVSPDGVEARVSPKRFGFTNSGSTFRAVGPNGVELASFQWSDAPAVSYTLDPQVDGSEFRSHAEVSGGAPMSPGFCANGAPLADGCSGSGSTPDAGHEDAGRNP